MLKPTLLLACCSLIGLTASTPLLARPALQIGEWSRSLSELDAGGDSDHHDAAVALFEERTRTAYRLLGEQLLQREAEARGTTVPDVIQALITSAVAPVSDTDIDTFIHSHASEIDTKRPGLRADVRGHLVRLRLLQKRHNVIRELSKKYNAVLTIPKPSALPPQSSVQGPTDLSRGQPDAPITIVGFVDFRCSYCRASNTTIRELERLYGDKLRYVVRHFTQDTTLVNAAQCARDQRRFWAFHDAAFQPKTDLSEDGLRTLGKAIGIAKLSEYERCLSEKPHADRARRDWKEGQRLGVRGTPAFFVNGHPIHGAQPLARFQQYIDQLLAPAPDASR